MRILFYKAHNGEHRWKVVSKNGRIIAASSEGFYSRFGAKRNFKLFIRSVTSVG